LDKSQISNYKFQINFKYQIKNDKMKRFRMKLALLRSKSFEGRVNSKEVWVKWKKIEVKSKEV